MCVGKLGQSRPLVRTHQHMTQCVTDLTLGWKGDTGGGGEPGEGGSDFSDQYGITLSSEPSICHNLGKGTLVFSSQPAVVCLHDNLFYNVNSQSVTGQRVPYAQYKLLGVGNWDALAYLSSLQYVKCLEDAEPSRIPTCYSQKPSGKIRRFTPSTMVSSLTADNPRKNVSCVLRQK